MKYMNLINKQIQIQDEIKHQMHEQVLEQIDHILRHLVYQRVWNPNIHEIRDQIWYQICGQLQEEINVLNTR